MLEFDPTRPPATPRDAASVLVLRGREADGPFEVFCVERHPMSGFLGGAVVFPGGKVEPADADPAWRSLVTAPAERAARLADGAVDPHAIAIAACRELLEEGAVAPTVGDRLDAEGALTLRERVRRGASLRAELERLGLVLDLARLAPFGRWVTPEAESRRFDARFFLLALPHGQVGAHDDHETTTSFWATPSEVLSRWEAGRIQLAPPTTRALELLAGAATIDGAIAIAATQSLLPICPVFVPGDPVSFLALPGDPAHPVAEHRISGPTRFVLREGRFVSENPQ